jgi:ribosomal protein S18 acetylase RimI-like enzyme
VNNEGGISIRNCRLSDLEAVSGVCFRTGYGGSDVGDSGLFRDRRLFGLLFSDYYVRYERPTSYVALSLGGRVVGYVLGCPDTERYGRIFRRRMIPRILARAAGVSLWSDPSTLRELLRWARGNPWREDNPAGPDFPAHLHIDLLPEAQRQGVGSRLIELLEAQLTQLGVPGIHLVTSNYNRAAIPFYGKHGYRLLAARRHSMWSSLRDYESLLFVKAIGGSTAS